MNRVIAVSRSSFNPFRSKSTPPIPAYPEGGSSVDASRRYSIGGSAVAVTQQTPSHQVNNSTLAGHRISASIPGHNTNT